MKLGFIVESRYLNQHMPIAVINALRQRDIVVDIINPVGGVFDANQGMFTDGSGQCFDISVYQAIVSRNRNALGLALLAFAESMGMVTLNSHSAVQKVRNKAKMAITLGRAGIATPPTLLADQVSCLNGHVKDYYPIILKATYGDNCQGLQLVRNAEALSEIQWESDVTLAQQYLPNDGYDLKLYVINQHFFAIRKPSPFSGDSQASIQRVDMTEHLFDMAIKCGELFGLNIYGVDTVESKEGPMVIEVNDFPNYSGLPMATELLADYIELSAQSRS